VCVCVAVSSWVCRSIVSRYVRLVRSGAWGLVPRSMYQSGWGFFLHALLTMHCHRNIKLDMYKFTCYAVLTNKMHIEHVFQPCRLFA